jgi:hypothetical protein
VSNFGDALSGGGTGVNDQTFADATLGDQMMGGSGDFSGGDISQSDAGGGGFQNFSNLANALSGGGAGGIGASPTLAQAASMAPPASAGGGTGGAAGSDPVGAASGTQSATPATPNQQSGGQNQNQQQQDQQYAPKSATDQLKTLLKALSGKPTGPTGPTVPAAPAAPFALPTLAAGQTGRPSFSPQMIGGMPLQGGIDNLPGLAAGETGPPSGRSPGDALDQTVGAQPAGASIPPGAAQQPTAQAAAGGDGTPAVDAQGNPVTAAGTPAADTPLPPSRPGAQTADAGGGGGRDITVRKPGGGAQPVATADLPTRVPHPDATPLPTHKPGAEPAPAPPTGAGATPRILQDISGASTGSPTALTDLAQAAQILLPLAGMLFGGGRGRRGGHFHGGRFTHGVGGFRGGHPGAFGHPAWRGAWPYHHPMHGWDMHHHHPGGGWLPLNPAELQGMGGGQQGGQPGQQGGPDANQPPQEKDPYAPPKETGGAIGTPDQVGSSGAIPGVSAKQVDDYTREVAQKYHIDPDVASKFLAQESSYGQARKPGDDGTSFGPFQLHFAADGKAMGNDFYNATGLDPRDPKTWKDQIDYAMLRAANEGWSPGWTTTMKKLGMNQWSGIGGHMLTAQRQPMSTKQPQHLAVAAALPTTLPMTSQPMVAGP